MEPSAPTASLLERLKAETRALHAQAERTGVMAELIRRRLPRAGYVALLANLRYRLEPRFAASDIELQWDVDLIPPLQRLDAHAMRQLQFMLFEAFSNVLQQAQASVLRIELPPGME